MNRRRIRSSRLSRTSEKQNKKQAVYFTTGIILLIIILIQFGPLLINVFGNVVYTIRGGDANDKVEVGEKIYQPPILIGIPEATQSSKISFSGIAPESDGIVEIYVNDDLEEEIDLGNKTDFNVEDIRISKGENRIKSRFLKDEDSSAFSDDYVVKYITEEPSLEISSPSDNATFTKADKSIQVSGKTEPENTVQVNSFRAIVDSDGEFSYTLQLNDGENQIVIEARNPAGITSQKQLKVTYSP